MMWLEIRKYFGVAHGLEDCMSTEMLSQVILL